MDARFEIRIGYLACKSRDKLFPFSSFDGAISYLKSVDHFYDFMIWAARIKSSNDAEVDFERISWSQAYNDYVGKWFIGTILALNGDDLNERLDVFAPILDFNWGYENDL